jgi:hypothetical protein
MTAKQKRPVEPVPIQPAIFFGLYASPNPRQRLSPLESAIVPTLGRTVSEFVSEKGGGVVKNSGELKRIVIDFIGDFAIFYVSDSMQQTVSICG